MSNIFSFYVQMPQLLLLLDVNGQYEWHVFFGKIVRKMDKQMSCYLNV